MTHNALGMRSVEAIHAFLQRGDGEQAMADDTGIALDGDSVQILEAAIYCG